MKAARCLLAVLATCYASTDLSFDKDGVFKIVQFTDMHYGEDANKDQLTNKLQATVLDSEAPQLAVFSGDAVSGYAWPASKPAGWYKSQWEVWTEPVVASKTPYAYTLGNHDHQADLTGSEIIALDMTNPLSLTQAGPKDLHGNSNYVLHLRNAAGEVAAHIFFFDSGDSTCLGVTGWSCVYPDTVEWYRQTVVKLEAQFGKKLPSVGFYHIPLDEMMQLFNDHDTFGLKSEKICCASVNTGLFAALVEAGSMLFMSAGHDHNNDFFGTLSGVALAYGRKTGHGGYGPPEGWERGSRVLELRLNSTSGSVSFDTWIRTESGAIIHQAQHAHPSPGNTTAGVQNICCGADGSGDMGQCAAYEAAFRAKLNGATAESVAVQH